MCCKVSKKVCEIVPKTVYDTVSRRECYDVAGAVCADIQEQKCLVSQKPVQETVSHQQYSNPSSGLILTFLTNLLRCQGDLAKTSLRPEMSREAFCDVKTRLMSQAISPIPSKWRNINERKCSDLVPRATYDNVKRRQSQDEAVTVCANANANKRKFQSSKRPVHAIVVEVIVKIKINKMLK